MRGATRELRRALAPLLASAGVTSAGLWPLLKLSGNHLWLSLAGSLALGLAAGTGTAWLVGRRVQREPGDPELEAARALARIVESTDAASDPIDALDSEPTTAPLAALVDRVARRVDRLDAETQHLLSILGSMSEGVLVADAEGRAMLINPSWRSLFDVTGEVRGRTTLEVTRQTALDRLVADTLATGDGRRTELEHGRRSLVLTSAPLPDGAGVVVLANDLTSFLKAGEIRRDFVANVSHELKTPLSAIRGFAETLRDGALEDPKAAHRFTERILRQCQRLETLLADLLILSRLEHPLAPTERDDVDLAIVAREAIDLTRETAVERDIELRADLPRVPAIAGDAEALLRLCINLVENGIKYNRPGGRVEISLSTRDDELLLEVADTGIGIPPESLPRLFERFYRVDKGRSRDEGGTGLGLAIVKHAAQLHGGSVEVESELGSGSRFRVVLPATR